MLPISNDDLIDQTDSLIFISCRFEEEKRGPFGVSPDSNEGSGSRAQQKVEMLPKMRTYRNQSASGDSSSSSGSSGGYKIEFDDQN